MLSWAAVTHVWPYLLQPAAPAAASSSSSQRPADRGSTNLVWQAVGSIASEVQAGEAGWELGMRPHPQRAALEHKLLQGSMPPQLGREAQLGAAA